MPIISEYLYCHECKTYVHDVLEEEDNYNYDIEPDYQAIEESGANAVMIKGNKTVILHPGKDYRLYSRLRRCDCYRIAYWGSPPSPFSSYDEYQKWADEAINERFYDDLPPLVIMESAELVAQLQARDEAIKASAHETWATDF